MKKLLLGFLLLWQADAFSQPYESMFGSNSTEWTTVIGGSSAVGRYPKTVYRVVGDSVIDNKSYKKVFTAVYQLTSHLGDMTFFLREDTDSGKVWIRKMNYLTVTCFDDDVLLCDFSLEKGDTFKTQGTFGYWAAKIDTVYTENGRKHLRLDYPGYFQSSERLEMIEGVGFSLGLLYLNTCTDEVFDIYTLCIYKDGEKKFANKYFNGDCYPYGFPTHINDIRQNVFSVFPNPARNEITIQLSLPAKDETTFAIQDLYGRKIKTGTVPKSQEHYIIPITDMPAGIYYLSLDTLKTQIFTKQ